MSVIVDFIVVMDGWKDSENMDEVNHILYKADHERHQQFRKLNMEQAGGTKFMGTEAWAAAFNHLLPETVRKALADANWEEPLEVFVLEKSGDYEIDLHAKTIADLRLDRVRDSFGAESK